MKMFIPLLIPLFLVALATACRRAPATDEVRATVEATPAEPAVEVVAPPTATEPVLLPYQDPTRPVEARVEDLLGRMTLAEKIGQMTLVEKNSIAPDDITALGIGALLSGGGGSPPTNTPAAWREMVDGFQAKALASRLGIPLLYGVDAVHGHGNVKGAVIFPHNIGLGATRDADLLWQIGRATAVEVAATGIHWNYAPVLAVPQDIRWGRTYEGYGDDPDLAAELGTAYLRGLQGTDQEAELAHPLTVLATPKHFVADGGTLWGTSRTYSIDQGDAQVDEATLRAIHLAPYLDALDAGAMSIMVSFSSWKGEKLHGHHYLVTEVLKGELDFEGFVVSDWGGIDQLPGDYYSDVVASVNAGVDMNMVPDKYPLFVQALTAAVDNGDVSMERIDDAVRRILRVKFMLGLFERPFPDEAADLSLVGSEAHRVLAREAVRKSLVLLENEGQTLPLARETPVIFVAGEGADDIGLQSGGWTIEWQGRAGNITPGTTILEGIEQAVSPATRIHYNRFGRYDRITDENGEPLMADVGIAVVAEQPYAEGVGDREDLSLSAPDLAMIERVRQRSRQLVVILVAGRPMIVNEALEIADAFVVAWLPGTEGQGVADVLFGDYPFSGQLPHAWPRSMAQVPLGAARDNEGCDGPLFPFGYGLSAEAESPALLSCP